MVDNPLVRTYLLRVALGVPLDSYEKTSSKNNVHQLHLSQPEFLTRTTDPLVPRTECRELAAVNHESHITIGKQT